MKKMICLIMSVIMMLAMNTSFAANINKSKDTLAELQTLYDDPSTSVGDIIRCTNPKAYASMTDKQRRDFNSLNYREAKQASNELAVQPRYITWSHSLVAAIQPSNGGRMDYTGCFQSMSIGGSSNCQSLGLCCTVRDVNDNNQVVGFESDFEYSTSYMDVSGDLSDCIVGHKYENECQAYGYDPDGLPFCFFATCSRYAT